MEGVIRRKIPGRLILSGIVMLAGVVLLAYGYYGDEKVPFYSGLILTLAGALTETLFLLRSIAHS